MKVVYLITRSDTIGGAQVYVRDLALRMKQQGHESIVIVGGEGLYFSHLKELGISVISISKLGRDVSVIGDVKTLIELCISLRRLKPDLVAINSVKAGVLGRIACMFVGCACVYTAHGWSHIRIAAKYKKQVLCLLERILSRISRKLIVVCEADKKYAEIDIGLSGNQIEVICNGISPLSCATKQSTKKKDKVKLISVARFQRPKDYQTIFIALSRLKAENWEMLCVGNGPDLEVSKAMVKELGLLKQVKFSGYVNEVDEKIISSDIFVLSSFSEGFPMSILEAMRARLPVVASNVGGVSESVINDVTGYLFSPGDVVRLTECLDALIKSPLLRAKYGRKGFERQNKYFSFDVMFSKTLHVYMYARIQL